MEHHADSGPHWFRTYCHTIISTASRTSSTLRYDMHLLLLVMFFILRAKLNLQHSCNVNYKCCIFIPDCLSKRCFLIGYRHPLAETEAPRLSSLQTATSENILFECLIRLHQHPSTCTHTQRLCTGKLAIGFCSRRWLLLWARARTGRG